MSCQNYQKIQEVLTDGDIPITHYVSKVTGTNIYSAYVEWPIVYGDLVFATEAADDDGLPHTLEHLVFLGSEEYPFKGVLDRLANKCFADGTNAMTDTDHTSYNLQTAGSDGFLKMLPIYLEHVLFPTLTDSGYITEVHHINGEGDDAGVVYCEMQARENSGDSRCYLEMLRTLYPGKCAYRWETGGILENLRTSTNNQKCRDYHEQFYHSKNLCIIVVGPVKPEEIFEAIEPVENKIVAKGRHQVVFDRPWQTPVEPMKECVQRKIQYSSDTDDDGLVYIGFRGPEVINNFRELVAISILLDYLNATAISPIQRDFVECEEPYCSSVDHSIIENSVSCFYLSFESVGKQYLDGVATKFNQLLTNIVEEKEVFDMQRLKTIISRKKVSLLSTAENSPRTMVQGPVIGEFLYGNGNLKQRCQEIPLLEEISQADSKFWLELIQKYMTGPDARHVVIVGEPSPDFMKISADIEAARLAKQKEELKDRLPEIAEKLKSAIDMNETPIPSQILESIEVPSTDKIMFHPIERIVLDQELTPFRFQYDSIKTNFVTIHILMNTSNMSKQDRLYLPLMSEIIMECPIMRDGCLVPYEKVVSELFADTISFGANVGLSASSSYSVGVISMLFGLGMQVESAKYERAVRWFSELLYNTVFTPERIKTIAKRMVSDISQCKRSGGKVLTATTYGLAYQSNSNQWACNFMRQQKFLKKLINNLDIAQKDLIRIRNSLTTPNNLLVHIALNKEKFNVTKLHEPWLKLVPEEVIGSVKMEHIKFEDITPCHKLYNPAENFKKVVVGVGSVESNYMYQIIRSIDSPVHPDLPAVYVFLQYLTQLEGPLWTQVRGSGLSYNYQIDVIPSEGLMRFLLYKSSQLVGAYNKTAEVVDKHLNNQTEFEPSLLESAKSSLIFDLVKREKSAAGKSMQSLLAYIRKLDIDYNRDFIKQVAKVDIDDMRRVGPIYLKPLFQDPERRVVVVCHPAKIPDISNGFESVCNLEKINIEEEQLLNSLE